MTDGFIQLPTDQSGKKVDTDEIYQGNLTLVERQRVSIPDTVDVDGDTLTEMLVEQRLQNILLAEGFRIHDNLDDLREEIGGFVISGESNSSSGRELLTADRTYYIDNNNGNDSNSGLTVGSPLKTIQYGWDNLFCRLDPNGHAVTFAYLDGVHADALSANSQPLPNAGITITSNSGNAAACSIQGVEISCPTKVNVTHLTMVGDPIGQTSLHVQRYAQMFADDIIFTGANDTFATLFAQLYGIIGFIGSSFTVQGIGGAFIYSIGSSTIRGGGSTITLTGTPAIGDVFCRAEEFGLVEADGITFVGSATGKRYDANTNGLINTLGGGATYLPGNVAGTTTTGGQYV